MQNLKELAHNVFVHQESISILGSDMIEFIKRRARKTPLQRARINFHKADSDQLHEMVIAMTDKTLVAVHKHPNRVESFHMIEGIVRVGLLDNESVITRTIELDSETTRYYRMSNPQWHIVVPISEIVVIHETTIGPFVKGESSIFPEWSLSDAGKKRVQAVREEIKARVIG